jgi:hypothetical protein
MASITQLSQLDLNKTYSYADYMTWQFSDRVELIKGKISLMTPGPNVQHQGISINLSSLLHNNFKHKNAGCMPHRLMCGFMTAKNPFWPARIFTP